MKLEFREVTIKLSELNLLVVDDDASQRKTVVNMLRALGVISISSAGNGGVALEIIRGMHSNPVNVALCNLNMPETDAMEFLRHLSQENENLAIIIISALDSTLLASVGEMTKILGIELLGTIEKPIMLGNLHDLLLKYPQHEQPRPEEEQ